MAASAQPNDGIRATFLGVSTILLDDGKTKIMTDGFFSRPSLTSVMFTKIRPNEDRINCALARAGITRLDALMPLHAHYDHALDVAEVARQTGAKVYGSQSTINIAQANGAKDVEVVNPGQTFHVGDFKVTTYLAGHAPSAVSPKGEITGPLKLPAHAWVLKEGGAFAYLIEHRTHPQRILINGSAGFRPGMFATAKADILFLSIGALGKQDRTFMDDFWREAVAATTAKQVFIVHWDDFTLPLERPLRPFRAGLFDDFAASMEFLMEKAGACGIDLRLPDAFQTVLLAQPPRGTVRTPC